MLAYATQLKRFDSLEPFCENAEKFSEKSLKFPSTESRLTRACLFCVKPESSTERRAHKKRVAATTCDKHKQA